MGRGSMRQRGRDSWQVLLRSLAVAVVVPIAGGCTAQEETDGAVDRYRTRVVAVEDEVLARVARSFDQQDPGAKDDPQIVSGIWLNATRWARAELKEIEPPRRYADGHRLLVDYYEQQVEAFGLEAQILRLQERGESTVRLERELEESGRRIVETRASVAERLPFVRGIQVVAG